MSKPRGKTSTDPKAVREAAFNALCEAVREKLGELVNTDDIEYCGPGLWRVTIHGPGEGDWNKFHVEVDER